MQVSDDRHLIDDRVKNKPKFVCFYISSLHIQQFTNFPFLSPRAHFDCGD